MSTSPVVSYAACDDLWIVTCYFNADRYRTKAENYTRFVEPLARAGMRLVTVECAFPWTSYDLAQKEEGFRVLAKDVMWQKERLLNLAIARLPKEVRKVAWLDCDVLFTNPRWALEASRLLEEYPVVQLFDEAVRLPRGHASYRGAGEVWPGFAATLPRDPDAVYSGRFDRHGHTGFAWAARRETLSAGLFDTCVAGSGDHLMAHAFCGDWDSPCIDRIVGHRSPHRERFLAWSHGIYPGVRARVGAVPGRILHLWHGDFANRRYVDRNRELAEFGFDPWTDLKVGPSGCWEWASRKPRLHRWASDYFGRRKEDGEAAVRGRGVGHAAR
jgi:hypothetical protein